MSRLEQLGPDLERHFDTPLTGCQPLKLLRYTPGHFFHAHVDNGSDEVAARRVSAVVFLNDQTDDAEPGSYSGGSLTFFGLVGGERGERVGFPLVGEKGLLVAFPAGMVHSVTPGQPRRALHGRHLVQLNAARSDAPDDLIYRVFLPGFRRRCPPLRPSSLVKELEPPRPAAPPRLGGGGGGSGPALGAVATVSVSMSSTVGGS